LPIDKQKLFSLLDRRSKLVNIEDIELKICEITLDITNKLAQYQQTLDPKLANEIYIDILTECVLDPETNTPVFSRVDVPRLMKANMAILSKLFLEVLNLSKPGNEELEGAMEELKKTMS